MPTFDTAPYSAQGDSAALLFGVLALVFDLLLTLVVVKEASERKANPLAWGAITLLLPLIGYAIWKASVSREDHPPDMGILLRELDRGNPSHRGQTPDAPAPSRAVRRPRNFF